MFVIRRGVIYGFITIVMAAILSVAITLTMVYGDSLTVIQRILWSLLLGGLASALFGPTKKGVEYMVDKLFYKDRYDYRNTIHDLSNSLNSITDITDASSLIVGVAVEKLNLAGGCLFVRTDEDSFVVAADRGALAYMEKQRQLLELLDKQYNDIRFPNTVSAVNPDVAFLIPLVADKKEIGVLCLSPKISRQSFSPDDLYLLQGLASVAAVSLRSTLIIARDIAERKKASAKLKQAAEEWRTTFDSIPDPISLQDKDLKIIRVNKAYADVFDVKPEQMIGKTCYKAVNDISGKEVDCPYKKMLATKKPVTIEYYDEKRHKNLEMSASPILDGEGNITASVHIIRDVTERRKSEEEKKKLEEKAQIYSRLASVGEMAAGIAHEINNPLTGVIGFSQLLLGQELEPEVKEQVQIIADGGNRVADIVKRLLTFARQTKPVRTSVSVNEIIDNTLSLRRYVLETANIKVVTNYDSALPWITADPGQLQQVFLNLIINAEYAMKKAHGKGKLNIGTKRIGDTIQISFKDDGIGISKENIERTFQPFFTTKPVGEGTGLGLSLSHSIILEHGGTIHVESEWMKGASFIIELPINETKDDYYDDKPSQAPLVKSMEQAKIIVVDDEPAIREFASITLSSLGHRVDATGDPQEALDKIAGTDYDVIFVDIRMPGMGGQELYQKITEISPVAAGRVVFITGDTSDIELRVFLKKYNLPYITKPFSRKDLEQKVSEKLASLK